MRKPDLTDLLRAQTAREQQKPRAQLPPWLRGDLPERTRDPLPTYADPTAEEALSDRKRTRRR
ncbi:hypothetical protein ACN082_09860 [Rothia sp. CCM 9417]|uniref:hypothetical protein n=1 Tax=Rothia sp. CCM 9417 TaxID=3402657 RepID=UPI003AE9A86A